MVKLELGRALVFGRLAGNFPPIEAVLFGFLLVSDTWYVKHGTMEKMPDSERVDIAVPKPWCVVNQMFRTSARDTTEHQS